jgi:tetratricopeptide (TPR) repeat protein
MPNPTQVAELLQAGIAAAKAGQTQEARHVLLRATELDERNEQAWLWLSGVVESIEDRRICLENVLAINPKNSYARAGLTWLDQQAPVPPATQERCPRCQSPVPLSGRVCPECGPVLIIVCPGCEQYVDVKVHTCPECGQFLGNFRDGAHYHLALLEAYLEQQQHVLAQEAAAHAEAAAPDDPQVLGRVAALYEEMGRSDQAIATYKQAIERDPGNASLYIHRGKHRSSLPERQVQGWGETLRRMGGLMLIPGVAALVNARLVPWQISLLGWGELVLAGVGAYLWVCATDVPRNPGMQAVFGQTGVKGLQRQILVGAPGAVLWTGALGLILLKT